MKTSNKILLAVAMVPVLATIFMVVSLRIAFEYIGVPDAAKLDSGKRISREYFYSDFNKITFAGNWKVTIRQGHEYRVEVSGEEHAMSLANVRKNGDQLILSYLSGYQKTGEDNTLEAAVTVPMPPDIHIEGTCRLELKDFRSDRLHIEAIGNVQMAASNTAIRDLDLSGRGMAQWDFSRAAAVNASVRYVGTFSIALFMNGGRLSGNLDGAGTLEYSGNADTEGLTVKNSLSRIVYKPAS